MKYAIVIGILLLLLAQQALAIDYGEVSREDKEAFNEILKPVLKIYNLVKYIASAIAVIFLLFSGIMYMTSQGDPRKREIAKNTAAYVIIGLIIIWAAPHVVDFMTS